MKLILPLLLAALPIRQDTEPPISMDEKVLATIPDGLEVKGKTPPQFPDGLEVKGPIVFRRDGKAVACVVKNHGKELVLFGKERCKEYDEVREPVFSPDGETLAYEAREGEAWFVVMGEKKGPAYFALLDAPPVFHPSGKYVAYGAAVKTGKKCPASLCVLVVNGQQSETYMSVQDIAYSPGGKSLVHRASQSNGQVMDSFMVLNGRGGPYSPIGPAVFAPKGDAFVYQAFDNNHGHVVNVDRRLKEYDWVGTPMYLADGKTIAYPAKEKGKIFPVVGEQKGTEYPCDAKWPSQGTLSPDGKRIAYVGAGDLSKAQVMCWAVVDGKKGPEFERIMSLIFSPDSKSYAYAGMVAKKWSVVFDGKKTDVEGLQLPIVFKPDGTGIAYVSTKDDKKTVVIGDEKFGPFDDVATRVNFSDDGKKAAFGVRAGRDLVWKVVELGTGKK